MTDLLKVFVAYPSQPPARREVVGTAAALVGELGIVDVIPWESLVVSGRLIIRTVLDEIDASGLVIADVSSLQSERPF